MTILVTGGAGFIGSNFVIEWFARSSEPIINVDKLTYAGNLRNISAFMEDDRHLFIREDISTLDKISEILLMHRPRAILNFAAESHVDRSISSPEQFITTNIVGSFRLLEAARSFWLGLNERDRLQFRFLQVSTDEVYGSLEANDMPFSETRRYEPNSPYSASKAASDHLVRSYSQTYGLPTLTTNCSNNYGPFHFPEKLIPLCINNALASKPLPIYGDGQQVRDWLYVKDHCSAIRLVLDQGRPGECYNIGGRSEMSNLSVVHTVCDMLDEMRPRNDGSSYRQLITHVKDRPGHDRRYAIDSSKIERELGWKPEETFESGLRKTVEWYLENEVWVADVTSGAYRQWVSQQYGFTA